MEKRTQLSFIKKVLRDKGEISRNFCLQNYLSRLGARINDLKNEGWEFDVERRNGDYVYKLKKAPYIPKVVYDKERDCMVIINEPKQDKLL